MKAADWDGYPKRVVAHCFSMNANVRPADIRIKACSLDEAFEKVARKLERRQDFLDRTRGQYEVAFSRII